MSGRGDEVEKRMHPVIPEPGVSLDSRLFCEDVIVLTFEISNYLAKGSLVIDLVSKARSVDDSERNSRALFVKFKLWRMCQSLNCGRDNNESAGDCIYQL